MVSLDCNQYESAYKGIVVTGNLFLYKQSQAIRAGILPPSPNNGLQFQVDFVGVEILLPSSLAIQAGILSQKH